MKRRCAICWNPTPRDKDNWKLGTNDTTWICKKCKNKKANRYWKASPTDEVGVDNVEACDSGDTLPADGKPGKFETAAAVEIMKLYCMDVGGSPTIAEMTGTNVSFVKETIAYWLENHADIVLSLRRVFIGKVIIPV